MTTAPENFYYWDALKETKQICGEIFQTSFWWPPPKQIAWSADDEKEFYRCHKMLENCLVLAGIQDFTKFKGNIVVCNKMLVLMTEPARKSYFRYTVDCFQDIVSSNSAILGLFLFIFVFSVQFKYSWMTGFEPQISGVGSNCSTNWATSSIQQSFCYCFR